MNHCAHHSPPEADKSGEPGSTEVPDNDNGSVQQGTVSRPVA